MNFQPWDNPMGTDGFEFVEYAAPDPKALGKLFENMGHDPPALGFGGSLGAQPPNTINFGPQSGMYCGGASSAYK